MINLIRQTIASLLLFSVGLLLAPVIAEDRVILEPDVIARPGIESVWVQGPPPLPDAPVPLLVVLRKSAKQLEQLHDTLMRVSDPRNADYGAHLTQTELRDR